MATQSWAKRDVTDLLFGPTKLWSMLRNLVRDLTLLHLTPVASCVPLLLLAGSCTPTLQKVVERQRFSYINSPSDENVTGYEIRSGMPIPTRSQYIDVVVKDANMADFDYSRNGYVDVKGSVDAGSLVARVATLKGGVDLGQADEISLQLKNVQTSYVESFVPRSPMDPGTQTAITIVSQVMRIGDFSYTGKQNGHVQFTGDVSLSALGPRRASASTQPATGPSGNVTISLGGATTQSSTGRGLIVGYRKEQISIAAVKSAVFNASRNVMACDLNFGVCLNFIRRDGDGAIVNVTPGYFRVDETLATVGNTPGHAASIEAAGAVPQSVPVGIAVSPGHVRAHQLGVDSLSIASSLETPAPPATRPSAASPSTAPAVLEPKPDDEPVLIVAPTSMRLAPGVRFSMWSGTPDYYDYFVVTSVTDDSVELNGERFHIVVLPESKR